MKNLIILTSVLLLLTGCAAPEKNEKNAGSQIIQENNSCNIGEAGCNKRGTVSNVIDREMAIINLDTSVTMLDSTVALFFSFDDCPWCYDAIQVLNGIYKNYKIPTYYVDLSREERVKENPSYQVLYEKIKDEVGEIMYVPFFVVIKDGEILGSNTGTVEDHGKIEGELPIMTEEQASKLHDIYVSLYELAGN